jgi:uncharacterized protein (TIGR02466 family)
MLNLFGVPVYFNNIKIKEKEKSFLINSSYKRVDDDNGYVTKNKYILNNKKTIETKKNILINLSNYLYNILKIKKNIKFKLLNSWCVKHVKNDYAHMHDHDNSFISGILYLKTNENSGNIVFHKNDSFNNIFPKSVNIEFNEYTTINSDYWSITPKEGDILFFPSNLKHSVTKNVSSENRYCCSFNFYPIGIFGKEDNLNVLEIK